MTSRIAIFTLVLALTIALLAPSVSAQTGTVTPTATCRRRNHPPRRKPQQLATAVTATSIITANDDKRDGPGDCDVDRNGDSDKCSGSGDRHRAARREI